MLVRLLESFGGSDWQGNKGAVVDRPLNEALRLIARNMAEPVEPAEDPQAKPSFEKREKATQKTQKERR
jgi:hypothetical protein